MHDYITYSGLGLILSNEDVDKENLVCEIKYHSSLPNKEIDLNDEYDVAETLAELLNNRIGVEAFVACEDDDGRHYVLFREKLPWEYTSREKELTREDVLNCFTEVLESVVWSYDLQNLSVAKYIGDADGSEKI